MAAFHTITYQVTEGVAAITLARPNKRNAISYEMFNELGEAADMASADDGVRGVLVSGQGPSFCAGIDLNLLEELAPMIRGAGEDTDRFRAFVRLAQRPFLALARMPKPALAAVQGHALGAGFQLALACDLRIAARDVGFGMLEARYGLIPDLGGMYRLTRLVGPARAKELVWTTRTVDAAEVERVGLANRVVDPSELQVAAEEMLRSCLAHGPLTAALTKALIDESPARSLEEELELEGDAQTQALRGAHDRATEPPTGRGVV